MGEWNKTSDIDCQPLEGCNDDGPLDIDIELAISHENFKGFGLNDIGILKLSKKVEYTGNVIYNIFYTKIKGCLNRFYSSDLFTSNG